jgi:glycosyltransferase involved in cell wall biosynthesis
MVVAHFLRRIRLEDGGVVRAVLDMCEALPRVGVEVILLTCDDTDVPDSWKRGDPGCPRCVRIDPPSFPAGLFSKAQLGGIADVIKGASVLHLHAMWTPVNDQLARMARRNGLPYVLSIHGMLDEWSMAQKAPKKRAYLTLVGRKTLNRAAIVHCTAEFEATQSSRWHSNPRMRIVPLVFDLSAFRGLPGAVAAKRAFPAIDTGRPILLFLSRVHPKKRPDLVIEAAARLRKDGVDCEVAIAGPGDEAYLAELRGVAERTSMADRTHFLGMVSGEAKVSLFEWASAFVLPTSQENFGFVLIEALASGTPVVTTKGVDIWPELEKTGAATIVDPVNAEAMARATRAMLERDGDDPGAKGRAWALAEFEGDSIARRYAALYEEAVRG